MLINSRFRKKLKIGILFLSLVLIFVTPQMHSAYAAGYSFGSTINLSNNAGDSSQPQLAASDGNVYIVWRDLTPGSTEVFFINSTDSGVTFPNTPDNLSNSAAISRDPQVAISGNSDVYIVWRESNDIFFSNSSDNGVSFGNPLNITQTGTTTSSSPQIVAQSSNDVFIAWQESGDIFFSNSSDNGVSFGNPINLNSSLAISVTPKLEASGGSVYVVWREGDDISFIRSNDNGDTFQNPINLSNTGSTTSKLPDLAASGANVYVVWIEGIDIFFAKSSNSGVAFGAPIDIGDTGGTAASNPQVSVSGDNVYVTWSQDVSGSGDISFTRSTDNGVSFGSVVNLSANTGASLTPKIAASNNNVTLVWRDDSLGNNEVFFRGSDDNGVSFGGLLNLSNDTQNSGDPQVALTDTRVYVVWDDDILFRAGTPTPHEIFFDKTQYTLIESAKLTVTDSDSNTNSGVAETIDVNIKSSTDPTGITRTLTETSVDTGVFEATLTFSTSTSSGTTLQASSEDSITASFKNQLSIASIAQVSINFKSGANVVTNFDFSDIANIEVNSPSSNVNPAVIDSIDVSITSTTDPSGITLTLQESGVNTAIFGGNSAELIFTDGDDLLPTSGTITITHEDVAANTLSTIIDTTTSGATSDSDNTGIVITLTETGTNTALFSGELTLTTGSSVPGTSLKVAGGDFVKISSASATTNALVIPNPVASRGAIQVDFDAGDTVTASFLGASTTVDVLNSIAPGGGGGGVVRPGLVLNIVAGLSVFGGGGSSGGPTSTLDRLQYSKAVNIPDDVRAVIKAHDPNKPIQPMKDDGSFDFPLSIDGEGYPLATFSNTIKTKTITTNTPTTIKTTSYSQKDLEHVTLYTNLRGTERGIADSDTFIRYNVGKPLEIVDPHGYIKSAEIIITNDGIKKLVEFKIIFAKSMEKSDIIFRSWDKDKRSSDVIILDALEITENTEEDTQLTSEKKIIETEFDNIPTELQTKPIPAWIKTTATWWSNDEINDSDFVLGIQYLIQEDIVQIPENEITSNTKVAQTIPSWIKNTADWWGQDLISDAEFTAGLQWLIDNGVMKV